jgi:hypothetical protein
MATVIQIKRSTGASAPVDGNLSAGEMAYVQDKSNDGASAKLYIESINNDDSVAIHAIGGKFYTDIIDGSAPTSSNFIVGNGATAGATLQLREDSDNGVNYVGFKAPDSVGSSIAWVLPDGDGSNGQFLSTDGSGNLTFTSATSTIAGATDTDISAPSTGQIIVHDGTDSFDNVSVSGDATLASNGALTIANDAVTTVKILNSNVTTAKIADDAVTLDKIADAVFVTEGEGISSNDNDTTLPTSAAVKDYVDSQVTAQDLDGAADSGTFAVDLDSQSLTVAGTSNEIETSASGQTVTIGLPDDVTIGNNLTVTGNLTVSGTTTTVDSTTVTIADPVFEIGDDASDDNLDRGIKFKYNDGSARIGFFGMDESAEKFIALKQATDTSSVFTGTAMDAVFGGLEVSGLALSGSITSVDGAAPTAGQLMIGNGSNGDLELATLTAGSNGVTITNGDGSITLENDIATTSAVGVASFASGNFAVSGAGEVTVTAIDGGSF